MEMIRGKVSREMDRFELTERTAGYRNIMIDLGTGDGRFVCYLADQHPATFVIGLDACRENLQAASRGKRANVLFVIANTQCLPDELYGLAGRVTINFPWGSLLTGLLQAERATLEGLAAITRPGALLDVRLNAGALAEAGCPFEKGIRQVEQTLLAAGFSLAPPARLDVKDLRACPSTWARRLAVGRDPRAVILSGIRLELRQVASLAHISHSI